MEYCNNEAYFITEKTVHRRDFDMSFCDSPLIICQLTDKDGKLVELSEPGAIKFSELCSAKNCLWDEDGASSLKRQVTVRISGYIVVYMEGKDLSPPIPFYITERFCIFAPKCTFLDFSVRKFCCSAVPVMSGTQVEQAEICITIDTVVRSFEYADVMVNVVKSENVTDEKVCISVKKVLDHVCLKSETCVKYDLLLSAVVSQYNALSDGSKTHYTNADELTEYGSAGILSPDAVSYYDLFINAALQPKVLYTITAGNLYLNSSDIPAAGRPVIITFVRFAQNHNKPVNAATDYFVAACDGIKNVFNDSDAISDYGGSGIPSPDEVSYFNLYINGALQPKTNYTVSQGRLTLNTSDIPPAGQLLTLEPIVIKDSSGRILKADVYSYNAVSSGNKIFTNSNEITPYGGQGITDPVRSSYVNLFVNGVLQPQINYSVREGVLTLNTDDAPQDGSYVTLQFVRVFIS